MTSPSILSTPDPPRGRGPIPWRRGLVLLFALLATGTWLAITPEGLLGKADAIGYAVCHRIDLRSFHLGVRALPLCARCSGMYLGFALAAGFLWLRGSGRAGGFPPRALSIVFGFFLLIFAVDGLNSYASLFPGLPTLYRPDNILRVITGTLLGLGMGAHVLPAFNQSVWEAWQPEPGLRSWVDFFLLLALAAVLVFLLLSGNPLLLYPLAIISVLTVLGILTLVYTTLILLVLRRENQARSWRDLFFPALLGAALAIVQILLIDFGRHTLTGTWGGFEI